MISTINRKAPEYKLWRANVYAFDQWQCVICKSKKLLEAHHIKPVRSHPLLALEPMNGITLCRRCHYLINGKEKEVSSFFTVLKANGVNSVESRRKLRTTENTEPTQSSDILKGVTTRNRVFKIEQFITRQVQCINCQKEILRHYYRTQRSKRFYCSGKCRGEWMRNHLQGKNNPNYKQLEVQNCLWCKKQMTPTLSDKHRKKKYCNNGCQVRYEYQNGLRKHKSYLNGKWSRDYECCKICGQKSQRHYGKGKCMTCYNQLYRLEDSNVSTKTLLERDDIV